MRSIAGGRPEWGERASRTVDRRRTWRCTGGAARRTPAIDGFGSAERWSPDAAADGRRPRKKISADVRSPCPLPYKVDPKTGYIDYEKLEEKAMDLRPKMIVCGGSAYARDWDYARFLEIADKVALMLIRHELQHLRRWSPRKNRRSRSTTVTSSPRRRTSPPRPALWYD